MPETDGETEPIHHRTPENDFVGIVIFEPQSVVRFGIGIVNNFSNTYKYAFFV